MTSVYSTLLIPKMCYDVYLSTWIQPTNLPRVFLQFIQVYMVEFFTSFTSYTNLRYDHGSAGHEHVSIYIVVSDCTCDMIYAFPNHYKWPYES